MRKAEKEIRDKFDDSTLKEGLKVTDEVIEMDNDIAIKKVIFVKDKINNINILIDQILMSNGRKIQTNTFMYDTLEEGTRILDDNNELGYKIKLTVANDTDRINLVNEIVGENGTVGCTTTFIYKDTLDKIK